MREVVINSSGRVTSSTDDPLSKGLATLIEADRKKREDERIEIAARQKALEAFLATDEGKDLEKARIDAKEKMENLKRDLDAATHAVMTIRNEIFKKYGLTGCEKNGKSGIWSLSQPKLITLAKKTLKAEIKKRGEKNPSEELVSQIADTVAETMGKNVIAFEEECRATVKSPQFLAEVEKEGKLWPAYSEQTNKYDAIINRIHEEAANLAKANAAG